MPPDVRRAYQRLLGEIGDKDKDATPDVVQHGVAGTNVLGITKTSITVNGKTYDSRDAMPAEVRELYDKAMAQAGAARSGVSVSLPHGGRNGGVRADYTHRGGRGGADQETSTGSRTWPVLLIGVVLGGFLMWLLLK